MTRALIVDWGGVLTVPLADAMRAWAQAEGMPYDEMMSLLDWYVPTTDDEVHIIHALERGESGRELLAQWLAEQMRTKHDVHVAADGLIDRMFGYLEPYDEILHVCREAKEHGWITAVLSNSWDNPYPVHRWDGVFDEIVISGQVGMRKPEERIFRHTLDLLGVAAHDAVFVDDEEPNIIAARAMGMTAILAVDHESAANEIRALLQQTR